MIQVYQIQSTQIQVYRLQKEGKPMKVVTRQPKRNEVWEVLLGKSKKLPAMFFQINSKLKSPESSRSHFRNTQDRNTCSQEGTAQVETQQQHLQTFPAHRKWLPRLKYSHSSSKRFLFPGRDCPGWSTAAASPNDSFCVAFLRSSHCYVSENTFWRPKQIWKKIA